MSYSSLIKEFFGGAAAPNSYDAKTGIYTISLLAPGFEKEQITIEVSQDGTALTVSGRSKLAEGYRTYNLSPDTDTSRISARLALGILTISIPTRRAQPASRKRIVNIA